jgi:hypothetical protein
MRVSFGDFPVARFLFGLIALVMESPLHRRFFDPVQSLQAAGIGPGQAVLEVGCGTGFSTIPAAELVSRKGSVYALACLMASKTAVTSQGTRGPPPGEQVQSERMPSHARRGRHDSHSHPVGLRGYQRGGMGDRGLCQARLETQTRSDPATLE